MKFKISKIKAFVIGVVLLALLIMATIYWYYYSYPTNFQTSGKFSVRGIDIGKSFENSKINASNILFRTFQEDDKFNMSMVATRGWEAKRLTVYNASIHKYPIIYDTILFQTNGSVSLQIIEPRFLFIDPQNLSISIFTGKADSMFFIAEAGGSLLVENVVSASIPLSKGSPTIDFQIVGGSILVPDSNPPFSVNIRENDIILIRLETQIIVNAEVVGSGKFGIESNTFSSVTLECWSSPLTAYFSFPEGFLSYANTIQQLIGSQNLNFTRFRGRITLLNPQVPHEITMQGYAERIYIGQTDVTEPNFVRDLMQTLSPFSALIIALVPVLLLILIGIYRDQRKERKEEKVRKSEILKGYLHEHSGDLVNEVLKKWFAPELTFEFLGGARVYCTPLGKAYYEPHFKSKIEKPGEPKHLKYIDQIIQHMQAKKYADTWAIWLECKRLTESNLEKVVKIWESIEEKLARSLQRKFTEWNGRGINLPDCYILDNTVWEIYGESRNFNATGKLEDTSFKKYLEKDSFRVGIATLFAISSDESLADEFIDVTRSIIVDENLLAEIKSVEAEKKAIDELVEKFKQALDKIVDDFEKGHIDLKGTCGRCKSWHDTLGISHSYEKKLDEQRALFIHQEIVL